MASAEAKLVCPKTGFVVAFDCVEESVVGFSKFCVFQEYLEVCGGPSMVNAQELVVAACDRSFLPLAVQNLRASGRDQTQQQCPRTFSPLIESPV